MTRRAATALVLLIALGGWSAAAVSSSSAAAPAAPAVAAPSAIVVETTTGAVAYARAPDVARPIASATKLMTALLTLERVRLGKVLRASSYRPLPVESKIDLRPGERMTVADLLRGLLLESANDAAMALAEGVGGSRAAFVRAMNARARRLGLRRTRYVDPIGIGPGNRSSARDLATLGRRLQRFPFFRRTVARTRALLRSGAFRRVVANRNTLVRLALVDGMKTGHTLRAGWVLVGSGRRGTGARRVRVISVVLADSSQAARDRDTLALLQWGVRRFRVARPVVGGRQYGRVPIADRRGAVLALVAGRDVRRIVLRGARRLALRRVGMPGEVHGPVRRGQRVASLAVLDGRREVARVPLVAAASVPAAGLAQRTKESLARPSTLLVLLAALVASVLAARMGLRRRERRVHGSGEEPEVA